MKFSKLMLPRFSLRDPGMSSIALESHSSSSPSKGFSISIANGSYKKLDYEGGVNGIESISTS